MDVTRRNEKVFGDGIKKALISMQKKLVEKGTDIAEKYVSKAVHAYDEENANLTGNLLNSIAGGVYVNKRLEAIITASDSTDIPQQTHKYVRVGDGGFMEYRTGDYVDFVNQYEGSRFFFQPVDKNKDGKMSIFDFFREYKPSYKTFEVVICASAPYADYLQSERGLDVLTTAYADMEEDKQMFKGFKVL